MLARLTWLRSEGIWPTGPRCSRTDAYGLVLLVSLHRLLGETRFLDEACRLVEEVERALGSEPGTGASTAAGIGAERSHPHGMWIFALGRLGCFEPSYRSHGIELARAFHERFVERSAGLHERSLRAPDTPDASWGTGRLDPFLGYVAYRSLDELGLSAEIADMHAEIERSYRDLVLTEDGSLGQMLWLTHFHPEEHWAELQRGRCLRVLEYLWEEPSSRFCREPGLKKVISAAGNHSISIGLQAVAAMPERVEKLRRSFRGSRDRNERVGLAHVMACCADLPGEMLHPRERT